jgi:hypothetical protein
MFDVRCSLVSYPIRPTAFQVSGGTEPLNLEPLNLYYVLCGIKILCHKRGYSFDLFN